MDCALPAQNFQQLADPIEVFGFINKAQKYVIDLFTYESPKPQEFSINTMQHGL